MARPLVPASDVYSLPRALPAHHRSPALRGPQCGGGRRGAHERPATAPQRAAEYRRRWSVIIRCLEEGPRSPLRGRPRAGAGVAGARGRPRHGSAGLAAATASAPRVAVGADRRHRRRRASRGAVGTGVFATEVTVPTCRHVPHEGHHQAGRRRPEGGRTSYQQATGKAQGTVLSQGPAAGASVKKGSAVAMVAVARACGWCPCRGHDANGGCHRSLAGGPAAGQRVLMCYSSSAPDGSVTGQAPAAGLKIESGSAVAVTVSKGPKPTASPAAVAVPDVTGQTKDKAVSTLTGQASPWWSNRSRAPRCPPAR